MQTVICMKWGKAYGVEYANKLYSMVRRNTVRPLRFICFTDDATGLDSGIEALPLPPIQLPEAWQWKPWRKISLWQRELAGISGDFLFLDLDVVVTGSVDAFFDFRPDETYCVIENWTQKGQGVGNTSVFRLRVGTHVGVYDGLMADPDAAKRTFGNSQTLASRLTPQMVYWPAEWCVSFKHTLLPRWPTSLMRATIPPPGSRVVCFMGHPKPPEALVGRWRIPWYKGGIKIVHSSPWIAEYWR